MDKVQGNRSWWSLVTWRFSPQPQTSDFGDMGDTIALDSCLDRDSRMLKSAVEPASPTPGELPFHLNRQASR